MEITLGAIIRNLREAHNMLLRELAAKLEIDVSLLSKIEKGHRTAKKTVVLKIAEIFNLDKSELVVVWFSDKIVIELKGQDNVQEILRLAEQKLSNGKR